jgi:polar amino acid transport system substrate-binding protein
VNSLVRGNGGHEGLSASEVFRFGVVKRATQRPVVRDPGRGSNLVPARRRRPLRHKAGLLFLILYAASIGFTQCAWCGPVYDQALRSGIMRVGAPYNAAPWGFFDGEGKLTGFEVELAFEMARHMNLKLELEKVDDNTWPALLSSGKLDAALCRIRHTRSLARRFDFSTAYFFDRHAALIQKGSFKDASELSGRKVAALQASVYEKEAMKTLRDAGDKLAEKNVVSCPDRPTCFLALGKEKAVGWLDSGMNLMEYAARSPGRFELLNVGDAAEEIAVALPQDDSAWRDFVNFTIQDMAVDGSLKKLYDKWFGPDTPYAFPAWRTPAVWPE